MYHVTGETPLEVKPMQGTSENRFLLRLCFSPVDFVVRATVGGAA